MFKYILPSLKITFVLAALTGLVFPALITAIGQFLFPWQANGSLIQDNKGDIIGSALIGQKFEQAKYFHCRPSAAGSGYCGEASGGTNLGPTSAKFILGQKDKIETKDINESYDGIQQLAQKYVSENFLFGEEKPPVDAVTRSASGLDPDISLANALFQARRIARVRNLRLENVISLINNNIQQRDFGIFGEPRINVLKLNLALEEITQ